MKLATRMWLLGAALPAAGTTLAILAGGWLFRANLERDLDRALAAQASSERVSLFDSPDGRPHIHIDPRGLPEDVRVASAVTLYDSDGDPIAHYPRQVPPPVLRVHAGDPDAPPRFEVRASALGRERILRVTVDRRIGGRNGGEPTAISRLDDDLFVLEIAAPLAPVDRAVRAYYQVTLGSALLLGAILFLVHGLHARRLAARVGRLAEHMAALREGQLDRDAPLDPSRDEIGELSEVVAEATTRLREARAAQVRLIADAAHELRTPLTLVRTSVDVALRRRRPAGELEVVLHDVRLEIDRVAQLATRLLDTAAAGQGAWDRTTGDLVEIAREAVESARATAETRDVLVELDAPAPVAAMFHPSSVRQALDNLLSNALRFAPPRSTILVTARPLPDGGGALSVHDDGPGIPLAEQERVFEPFHRATPSNDGGAGLGLAIVRRIAEKHGGRAFVAAAERGTTVVVEFPAQRGRAAAGARR